MSRFRTREPGMGAGHAASRLMARREGPRGAIRRLRRGSKSPRRGVPCSKTGDILQSSADLTTPEAGFTLLHPGIMEEG